MSGIIWILDKGLEPGLFLSWVHEGLYDPRGVIRSAQKSGRSQGVLTGAAEEFDTRPVEGAAGCENFGDGFANVKICLAKKSRVEPLITHLE